MSKMRKLQLDDAGIDEMSEAVAAFLDKAHLDRRGVLSARLSFENCLISLRDHFGADAPVTLWTGRRLGRPRLEVRVAGERFDPREAQSMPDWEQSLLENAGLKPTFIYRGGHCIVALSYPFPEIDSTLISFFALVLGVTISFAGNSLPAATRASLLNDLFTPLADTFVAMLAAIAGPLVFFSVAWGICGIGDMASLERSGKTFIGRFVGLGALTTTLAVLGFLPLLRVTQGTDVDQSFLGSLVELVLGLLPTNFLQPFLEGNTLQIIVLAIIVGVTSLALGETAAGIRAALRALNSFTQFLMEMLCRLLPGFIVVMMVSQAWSGTASGLLSSWVPILLAAGSIVVFLALLIVVTCLRHNLSVVKVVRACFPAGFLAFTTASPSAAFGTMLATCTDEFGVDSDQASFGVPLGMVLCKPATPILLVAVMLYCAQAYGGGGADLVWYVRLAVTCVLYAIAVPPVPGGMLACYGMIFASLGIPAQAIGVATALDLLLDNPVCCTNVLSLILEVFSATKSMGAVDEDVLAKLRR